MSIMRALFLALCALSLASCDGGMPNPTPDASVASDASTDASTGDPRVVCRDDSPTCSGGPGACGWLPYCEPGWRPVCARPGEGWTVVAGDCRAPGFSPECFADGSDVQDCPEGTEVRCLAPTSECRDADGWPGGGG